MTSHKQSRRRAFADEIDTSQRYESTALDVAEALHVHIEEIEALASVLASLLQDVRLGSADEGERSAARRFACLVQFLAERCEETHASGSEMIEQVVHGRRSRIGEASALPLGALRTAHQIHQRKRSSRARLHTVR